MSPNKPDFIGGIGGGPPKLPKIQLPAKGAGCSVVMLILVVVMGWFYFSFLEYVRPNEYGIKEIQIGVNRGIQEGTYDAGLHFVLPFGFQKIHRLPRHVQVLELTDISYGTAASSIDGSVYYDKPATIQTSDGFFVDVDVTILYRITDPYLVVTQLGTGMQFLHQGIMPKAEPFLKQSLGELTTEEFYDSPLRVEKAEKARTLLDEELSPMGLRVDHVLVRYFKYSDEIQENIEAKKLQDQLVFTNESKRNAAEESMILKRISEEGEAQITITLEGGEAYNVLKKAERDLYDRKKRADGDLLTALAEAERSSLINDAMQSVGADRKVAMEMAQVLEGLDVVMLPMGGGENMNPLDLDSVLDTFGVREYMAPVVEKAVDEESAISKLLKKAEEEKSLLEELEETIEEVQPESTGLSSPPPLFRPENNPTPNESTTEEEAGQ